MNSYNFFKFIYEFICFMNSYMNSGVPRFQMQPSGRVFVQFCLRRTHLFSGVDGSIQSVT